MTFVCVSVSAFIFLYVCEERFLLLLSESVGGALVCLYLLYIVSIEVCIVPYLFRMRPGTGEFVQYVAH